MDACRPQDDPWPIWVALGMVRGIGCIRARGLVRVFGSPAAVFAAPAGALGRAGLAADLVRAVRAFDGWPEAEAQVARLRAAGGRLLTWKDPDYPELLREIYDAPLFLHLLGELSPTDAAAVAVVGSRDASRYGLRMTAAIGAGLARQGITVVSGLARGIDAAAHAAALDAGGRTIAVLGSGIDVIYPSEHHRLFTQIVRNGAVLSEFPMGATPEPHHFPVRNRIISGLSRGTVVIEATERSGSLITARAALDQGREVLAVPGQVGARSRGPHRLIRAGATLVESAEDVLAEIAPQLGGLVLARRAPAVEPPASPVLQSIGDEPVAVDEIVAQSGLSAARVLQVLLELELAGLVRRCPGQTYVREPGGSAESVRGSGPAPGE